MNETTKESPPRDLAEKIEIVQFQEEHAQSLADMWNDSKEEWGGQDGNRTAKQVKTSIQNEGNIRDFVALEGKTVVGYCSFKEYEGDEGASYIPLLNVRPQHHGKKIGKKLLLKAMEVAVEQQWPRMDLYTWSSNLKAVPLYKKCGFFWEKENPYIHLMNFMPTVLNTEALKPYFGHFHWYDDVARELLVEPDGRVEKGFHFYEYLWKKEKETLQVEFCRRGRGLRLIDTKDYKVVCYTDQNEFAFGKGYPVYYHIINKTSSPLRIELQGRDDKNIRYDFGGIYEIQEEKIIEGEFFLGEMASLYPELLTHPNITTDMMINGKKATFKLGIVPKFPVDIAFKLPQKENFTGKVEKGYLDIENGFDEEVLVSFELEESSELVWEHPSISLPLQPKEKKSLPLSFKVKKPGFYQEGINVEVKLPKEALTFEKTLKAFIRGRRGKYFGETDEAYSVVNGSYKLSLEKHENLLVLEDLQKKSRDVIFYPKLGIPYNADFSSKPPKKVLYDIKEESIILRGIFESQTFPGVRLHSVSELYFDGIVKQHYEVENTGWEALEREFWVSASLYHPFADSYLSYDEQIINVAGMEESRMVYYDMNKLTENWIYAQVNKNSWGMVWPKDIQPEQEGPFLKINEKVGKLQPGDLVATKPLYMLYNAMRDWQEIRSFALETEEVDRGESITPLNTLDIRLNNGNPFVFDPPALTLEEIKEDFLSGKVSIRSDQESFPPLEITYKDSQELRKDKIILDPTLGKKEDRITIDLDLKKVRKTYEKDVFYLSPKGIVKTTEASKLQEEDLRREQQRRGDRIYRVNNGPLTFACDPDYLNGIFSLTLDGKEYLDSAYPKYVSKSFWSPWAGGISTAPEDYELEALLKEKRRAEFVKKTDNKGNLWEGLRVTTEFEGIKKLKGVTLHHYFLTLPGVPLLSSHLEIEQKTGKYIEETTLQKHSFFRLQEDLSNTYFAKITDQGQRVAYKAGNYMVAHNAKEKSFEVGSFTEDEKVWILHPTAEHLVGFTNKELLEIEAYYKVSAKDQSLKALPPQFMVFTHRKIMPGVLEDLQNIHF